ncbi:Uncharacterized protein APZ42_007813, partial [Daphnia magna]
MALFLKDEVWSRIYCRTKLSPWRGQQTIYLGHRRWGYSTTQGTTITFTCPHERGRPNTVIEKEAFDVFEVPMSCSAHTDDWIFQASLKKSVIHPLSNHTLPTLTQLENLDQLLPEDAERENPPPGEKNSAPTKPLLSRHARFGSRLSLMGEHLRAIEEQEKARVDMEVN